MVKQDAMNVFLGFYVPNEMIQPLWDLDSDYFLHNKTLRPPVPSVNKILYREDHLAKGQGLGPAQGQGLGSAQGQGLGSAQGQGLALVNTQDKGLNKHKDKGSRKDKEKISGKHKDKGSEAMLKRYL